MIERIYFMIHPTCWSQQGDNGVVSDEFLRARNVSASNWYAALNWERKVVQKQLDFISNLRPTDAMVVYPIGQSPPMRQLLEHATSTLGKRCIVQTAPVKVQPLALNDMKEPIRHFLEDAHLEGRDEFWSIVPPALREPIISEIRCACEQGGYDWSPLALKVIVGNRVYTAEIAEEIRKRDLQVDPDTVQAEAFGEGFEQCAMTWKSMVAHYLGWRNPIENNFELSVTGFSVMHDVTFRERLALKDHIRLFLWEKSHGRPAGLFAKAQCLLTDPRTFVSLPLDQGQWEIWSGNDKIWPRDDAKLRVKDGHLQVPVYDSIRKHADDQAYYIIGPNLEYSKFREILSRAAHFQTMS